MYNEYIYEKQLKEKKLKELENEKMTKYRKFYIKKRDKLTKQYYQKVERFMREALNDLESQLFKNNYFKKSKNNFKNKTDNVKRNNKEKKIINRRIICNNSFIQNKYEKKKENHKIIKMMNNNKYTASQLPKMRFGIKNDLERIRELLYKRDGKIIKEKYLKIMNEKIIKQISKQNFDFLKIKKNNSINNNINLLNTSGNSFLMNMNYSDKKDENLEKFKNFKNRILHSKLIKSITFNEKYKKISFFKGMKYSLLNNKNITISNNTKLDRLKSILSPFKYSHPIIKTIEKKERNVLTPVNSINYHNDENEFIKFNINIHDPYKSEEKFEESSDSSVNDNGQEEIQKKLLTLDYPVLKETIKGKKGDNKNDLIYLKKLIDEGIKVEEEHQN